MAKKPYYITTAIAYASGKPHIGNTYEIVLADSIARYKRFAGYDVRFQTGTDEHGQKIENKAFENMQTPKEFVDEISGEIKNIWDLMNTSYDKFIRTTDADHEKQVQKIFKKMYAKGDIYKGHYEGMYCTPCESFFTESQLVDGKCPDCGRPVQKAKEEAYIAQKEAEQTRADLERATQQADIIVKAQIQKEQAEIEAEAAAEVVRRKAKGDADAIYAKMEAQARGAQEILSKQAQGMRDLVAAAGGDPDSAVKLIVADKIQELMQIQVDAIKNIKIDKVTVWDSMNGKDGTPTTANFLSGMMKSIPPMNEMFKQAGMELPSYLGKELNEVDSVVKETMAEKAGETKKTAADEAEK